MYDIVCSGIYVSELLRGYTELCNYVLYKEFVLYISVKFIYGKPEKKSQILC